MRIKPLIKTTSVAAFCLLTLSAHASNEPLRVSDQIHTSMGSFSVLVNPGSAPIDPNCEADVEEALKNASKEFLGAYTPQNPSKTFNDSVSDCLSNIQSFELDLPLASILGFDFSALMDQLTGELMDKVIGQACKAAVDEWQSSIDNALNSIDTGVNQFGQQQIDAVKNLLNKGSNP